MQTRPCCNDYYMLMILGVKLCMHFSKGPLESVCYSLLLTYILCMVLVSPFKYS